MKFKSIKKVILSSLVLTSIFLQANTSYASGNNNIYYYNSMNIDESYMGRKTQSSGASFEANNYKGANTQVVSYYIQGNKAYKKLANGKSELAKNSLVNVGGKTYYAGDNGSLQKGLRQVDGKYYYFNNNFILEKNTWKVLGDRLISSDKNGLVTFPANQSITIDDVKYKTDANGYLKEVVINKEPEDLGAIDKTPGLNNSSDPMSPTYRQGLSASELELVINTAFQKNKLIKDNDPALTAGFAETLVELENELGINPFFILGIINAENPILRGEFSNLVAKKNNLMSWAAYDHDPFNKATTFNNYSAAVIHPSRFLAKNYLNTNGKYYVDGTVKGVNKHYATAKNWHANVNSGMKRLNKAKTSLGL